LPKRLLQTWQFFDKAKDADGAKNIAAQIMTAERLQKEGRLSIKNSTNGAIPNDQTNQKLSK
jgi:hypothetical protein